MSMCKSFSRWNMYTWILLNFPKIFVQLVFFFLSDVTSNLVQCIFFLEKNVSIQFDHSLYDIVGDAKTNARSKKHLFICFTNINIMF